MSRSDVLENSEALGYRSPYAAELRIPVRHAHVFAHACSRVRGRIGSRRDFRSDLHPDLTSADRNCSEAGHAAGVWRWDRVSSLLFLELLALA
jgi:hypothetical protein